MNQEIFRRIKNVSSCITAKSNYFRHIFLWDNCIFSARCQFFFWTYWLRCFCKSEASYLKPENKTEFAALDCTEQCIDSLPKKVTHNCFSLLLYYMIICVDIALFTPVVSYKYRCRTKIANSDLRLKLFHFAPSLSNIWAD